ncbi:hypothetical protein GS532_29490 [Rhodococcus hoagii]|nr:hypothetical protein [Prescottella equi]
MRTARRTGRRRPAQRSCRTRCSTRTASTTGRSARSATRSATTPSSPSLRPGRRGATFSTSRAAPCTAATAPTAAGVHGLIYATWRRSGFENGPLGWPTSDEVELDNGDRVQHFEGGDIYWSPTGTVALKPANGPDQHFPISH